MSEREVRTGRSELRNQSAKPPGRRGAKSFSKNAKAAGRGRLGIGRVADGRMHLHISERRTRHPVARRSPWRWRNRRRALWMRNLPPEHLGYAQAWAALSREFDWGKKGRKFRKAAGSITSLQTSITVRTKKMEDLSAPIRTRRRTAEFSNCPLVGTPKSEVLRR